MNASGLVLEMLLNIAQGSFDAEFRWVSSAQIRHQRDTWMHWIEWRAFMLGLTKKGMTSWRALIVVMLCLAWSGCNACDTEVYVVKGNALRFLRRFIRQYLQGKTFFNDLKNSKYSFLFNSI